MESKLALLACLASTWFMTGLIWFVQVVHYPLFARVSPRDFGVYHAEHVRLVTYVVLVPMVIELVTSGLLVIWRPVGVSAIETWVGLGAATLVWGCTIVLQVPLHARLGVQFEPELQRALVQTNIARTVFWTVHALVLLTMTARAMNRQ